MKTKEEFPTNYSFIKEVLGGIEDYKPIFCYGDTIYNPFKVEITPDLDAHEKVHSQQQGAYPDIWWNKYLASPQFRLEQEIEAYGTQLRFIMDIPQMPSKLIEWKKEKMAEALSSSLYGNLLSYGEAISKIRNYAKSI